MILSCIMWWGLGDVGDSMDVLARLLISTSFFFRKRFDSFEAALFTRVMILYRNRRMGLMSYALKLPQNLYLVNHS
jgi:hypothetical protein